MKLYSSRVLAQVLDLTERRIRQLRDEGVLMEQRPGYYELVPSVQAYVRYLHSLTSGNAADYNLEKSRLVRAKREAQELELCLRRGELYRAQDIEDVVTSMLIRFKTRLLALPNKLAPRLSEMTDTSEIQQLVAAETGEALDELSDFKSAMEVTALDEAGEENDRPFYSDI